MVTIETIVEIAEDGMLVVKAPGHAPRGRRRIRIEIDDGAAAVPEKRPVPDFAGFRARLGAPVYPGNTILEMREEERS
ncbi:MAG: hypothetical protein PHU25_10050 [Deltaproteobacteria bacterium]|nr:hypothetical protein [Deltaproteobacteria bacterium]